jgi:hypothetical protein
MRELTRHLAGSERATSRDLFVFEGGRRQNLEYTGSFFLRASTEYSNPQLTLEDFQGILTARILEICVSHTLETGREASAEDIDDLAKRAEEPPKGPIVPFLMNTDDVEADRYSINPLRASILETGRSAFPAHNITTEGLKVDDAFLRKYAGILITESEASRIQHYLENAKRYVDAVDAMKYDQLRRISDRLGIQLTIPAIRMPLEALSAESQDGPMHQLIRQTHSDYGTISIVYELMGRSIKKRKTLLPVVPHSGNGVGSKRAASGKLIFDNDEFRGIKVSYKPTLLYPNDVDASDVSIARACEDVSVEAKDIIDYNFKRTPASPQFALYSILSPEAAAVWHGVGPGGHQGAEIVKSYLSVHAAHSERAIFGGIPKPYKGVPLQMDLCVDRMLRHPVHKNIDASIETVDLTGMLKDATATRVLPMDEFVRRIRSDAG